MKIDADLPFGKISIKYAGENKRRVTSELFDKIVSLDFPGDENWKINGNIVSMQSPQNSFGCKMFRRQIRMLIHILKKKLAAYCAVSIFESFVQGGCAERQPFAIW